MGVSKWLHMPKRRSVSGAPPAARTARSGRDVNLQQPMSPYDLDNIFDEKGNTNMSNKEMRKMFEQITQDIDMQRSEENNPDAKTSQTAQEYESTISDAYFLKSFMAYHMYAKGDTNMINEAAKAALMACKHDDKQDDVKHHAAAQFLMEQYRENIETPERYDASMEKTLKRVVVLGKKAIKFGDKDQHTITIIGEAYGEMGEFDKSMKYLRHAAHLDPDDPAVKMLMITTTLEAIVKVPNPPIRRYREALELIDSAERTGIPAKMVLVAKATLHVMFNKTAELKKTLLQMESIEPVNSEECIERGELYEMLGDKSKARHYMNMASNF